ncbi:MAG: metallophosphoesterase [Polyangiaceae bacterium]|nr:metallophosphoesterase [Polyangiaceae bacterium]MCL4749511.1 metallophosphoesterase [Myxococcales bacterium]
MRVLFFSDTHLGLDGPSRPRVARRRQGDDFFANTERAVTRALAGDVDLVVHGGDVFHRSDVPLSLAERAYALLRRVADHGVPLVLVPGNHERAALPFPLLLRHPAVFVFDRPKTLELRLAGLRVAIGGFPYLRHARARFTAALAAAELSSAPADLRLLCMHHCFEGAQVGPHDWTFRDADDVVRAADLPEGLSAVLSGHIHRHQVLRHDLRGAPLRAPVLYPGSVERTSSAERGETKGYLTLDFDAGGLAAWQLHELPTRPLAVCTLRAGELRAELERLASTLPEDAVLVLRVEGKATEAESMLLSAAALRERFGPRVNVRVSAPRDR